MEESQVKLHSSRTSPYAHQVIWALKLKGIKYEFIVEDLSNKSPTLLKYNPIHKKVPVLVHGGKPLVESAVIQEYIEETWPDRTPLLPKDPYERAIARFWIDFRIQKNPVFLSFFLSSEENREKAANDVLETLKIIQDQALGDKKFFGGNTLNLVDLTYGWLSHWFECMEELVGLRVLEPNTLPRLYQWTLDFKQEPVIKENLPQSAAVLANFKKIKETRFSAPKNN